MAKKMYDEPIDKNIPWDGNELTGHLPVRGRRVEEFLKGALNSKMGFFYYDATANRYLVFADEGAKDEYLKNPTQTTLVLGSFDAPFNYEASISLLTPSYNAIFLGKTGNYLDFTFDIKNKSGNSTVENVTVTYTFIRNAAKKVITETRKYGETVHFNIDDYLLEGTNTVIVGISGQSTLAATTAALTYQVINLSFSDNLNISKTYNLSGGSKLFEVSFEVMGYGTKVVEWFLDGKQLPFVKTEDEVVDLASQRNKYIELSNLASGIHTLQSRAYTVINGEKFYTDILYREIMVNNGDTTSNLLAVATQLPNSHGIVTESNPLVFYGAEQYIPYEIRFATRKTADVTIHLGEELLATINAIAGTEVLYSVTSNKSGTLDLKLAIAGVEREIPLNVNNTSLNIEEIKTGLSFDFRAAGRSNTAVDKDSWSYGDYTATFRGFNWNASSGWVNNALLINSGASLLIDIAPLVKDATSTGKTLEFEFATRNVENDDAVVCDLTTNGNGLLITASEARLTSAAGEVVSTRFKAGEVNRIAFVINKKSGATYKGLVFIYVNGILSGAINYGSADNFISNKQLTFTGTDEAQVELRSMRFYDTVLSSDNILNNYILYRDSLIEMMEVYYRNDIYAEGSMSFSPDAMLHRLPVMVITGDIPTLEGATSTSTQIVVDIEYTNEQDPTKNFKMSNAALRIQGTSSLAYPRKNFRFYTKKEESTIVYDFEGKRIENKLYSFKDGAQPVDCWCLKADFAESSGTHNTGIARIWNKVMYNAIVQHKNVLGEEVNGYVLRTEAQKAALASGYEYDVRTTIDGFPIALFYKKSANDTDLIFLGKYNFNNDKSTPSVFGFENIPGFDNSRMQCWETKDNGHPLGLFTDISGFDANWSEAFESRYPDTKSPNTADLKAFSLWINGVSQSDFKTQKWAHFDVYKVAAYYCYLMRFGAVDQPVKNAFLTSEDGIKFFFINYDNDTINGLINTGRLLLDPTVNRDTIGADGEYVYAGHDSVLWKKLTSDSEFMEIVSIVDNALYSAGLRYDEVIAMFNDEQADKWVERVYNQDAEYKYLLPYVNQATNNLFMLQGSRSSHRSWWLSKRFSLYDSLFLSGAYRDRNVSFKCLNDTQPGQQFSIKAGTKMDYGYGVNNGMRETGIKIEKGETHTFTTTDTLNLGDVVKIFAAANIEEIDFSEMANRLAVLDCSAATDPALGSKMKKLLLGGKGKANTELESISGINVLTTLQELNVEDYQNITSLDLTAQRDMRKVYAYGSSVASIDFATGAPVDYLELPSAMMALSFNQLPYLTLDNIKLESGLSNIHTMSIYGCPTLTSSFSFVKQWVTEKTTEDIACTIAMDNVDWSTSYADFMAFSQHKANGMTVELKGKVFLSSLSLEQASELKAIWGEECFDNSSEFYITAPDALYISPDDVTILEGESVQFIHILISDLKGTVTYRISSGNREGTTLNETTGLLTTVENGANATSINVTATFLSTTGVKIEATAIVRINKAVYPTESNTTIAGQSVVGKDAVYSWGTSAIGVSSNIKAEWLLEGDAVTGGYISLGVRDDKSCTVKYLKSAEPNQTVSATLTVILKRTSNNDEILRKSKTISMNQYVYPSADDTTVSGEAKPTTDNPVYSWESTVEGNVGQIDVEWTLDEALQPYFEVQNSEWSAEGGYHGSCTLKKIADVPYFVKANVNVTIKSKTSGVGFTKGIEITVLGGDVVMTIDTNPEVLAVLYNAGLVPNSQYVTKADAAAVKDNSFNPTGTQTGSIFYNNKNITSFDELQYFTGLTQLDAYTFYNCNNLSKLIIPENIKRFCKYCCYINPTQLYIPSITVEYIELYAFGGRNQRLTIGVVNWNTDQQGSTTAHTAFNECKIENLNVYKTGAGSYNYAMFKYAHLMKIWITSEVTVIAENFCSGSYVYEVNISDSVTDIKSYAFAGVISGHETIVNSMSSNLTSIGSRIFSHATIKCDLNFNKLSFGSGGFEDCSFEGIIDISETASSQTTLNTFFYNATYCKGIILSLNKTKYVGSDWSNLKCDNVYIPDIKNYCLSLNSTNLLKLASNVYYINPNSGEYVLLENLDLSNLDITSIGSNIFNGYGRLKSLNASGVKMFGDNAFNDAGLTSVIIDNKGKSDTMGANAFANNPDLAYIDDKSSAKFSPLSASAFNGVNKNAVITSQFFTLLYQNTGISFPNLSNNSTTVANIGTTLTFNTPYGCLFADGSSQKTHTAQYSGKVEDLTDLLEVGYTSISIMSNKDNAEFRISFKDFSGVDVQQTVNVGTHQLNAKVGTYVTIEAISIFGGFTKPDNSTIQLVNPVTSAVMDYVEDIVLYIAHKDGRLFSIEEWSSGGYDNADAEGVCVMKAGGEGFIIAKNDVSSSKIKGAIDNRNVSCFTTTTVAIAETDMNGYDNTNKFIQECQGITSSGVTGAPSAESCYNYIFPSGANGYLPAMGELVLMYRVFNKIQSAMTLIGGEQFKADNYWSSTQYNMNANWYMPMSSGKTSYTNRTYAHYVRAFSRHRLITIESNISTTFTVVYTNNYNETERRRVGVGDFQANIKYGTQVTITPDSVAGVTAEPQTFTWNGFTKTVSFVFAKDAGVYIQHIDGSLYTTAEWTSGGYTNNDANGVAVLSSFASFVMAKQGISATLYFGGFNMDTPGAKLYTTGEAVLDFDGEKNTDAIISAYSGKPDGYTIGAPIAERCVAYTFPNGKKGYLPSVGEVNVAYQNKSAIDAALVLIGGSAVNSVNYTAGFIPTSTITSKTNSFRFSWKTGAISSISKTTSTSYCYPFSKI